MKKVNVGIVGLGRVSQLAYLNNLVINKNINSLSVCDKNKDLLNKVSKKYKILKKYLNYEEMLQKESLDLVILVVNKFLVEEISQKILNDKKSFILFTEKPFALSYKKAKKLVILSSKKKKTHLVGYMKRSDGGISYLKNKLNSFKLGKITSVNYFSFDGNSFDPQKTYIKYFFNSKKKNYPILNYLNTQCHSINLLEYLFGKIKLEYSDLKKNGEGVVFFKNKKNIKIVLINKFNKFTNWFEKISIVYEKGIVNVNLPAPFYKNKKTIIKVKNFSNKKVFIPKLNNKNWSFTNQVNLIIEYAISKKTNKNIVTKSELCATKNFLHEFKIIERIFNI